MKSSADVHSPADQNLQVYNAAEVVAHYGALAYLSPAETQLFERYLPLGARILDLGVGGGRTTAFLSTRASYYVGADYATEMVELCRRKFPQLPFVVADAHRLHMFADASFDGVIMAFNGFDYVLPNASRRAALAEIRRVLKPGGVFIFSSHNPRAIWQRISWNPRRVDDLAARIAGAGFTFKVARGLLQVTRLIVAAISSLLRSIRRAFQLMMRSAFWTGEGYMVDVAHGGLITHYAVPRKIEAELVSAGFKLLETLGDDFPARSHLFVTPWYYYVGERVPADLR